MGRLSVLYIFWLSVSLHGAVITFVFFVLYHTGTLLSALLPNVGSQCSFETADLMDLNAMPRDTGLGRQDFIGVLAWLILVCFCLC